MDLVLIVLRLRPGRAGLAENVVARGLAGGHLAVADLVQRVALALGVLDRGVQLALRDAELLRGALADVDVIVLVNLILEDLRIGGDGVVALAQRRIEQVAHGGFVSPHALGDGRVAPALVVQLQRERSVVFALPRLGELLLVAKLRGVHAEGLGDLDLGHARALELGDAGAEADRALIGVLARTPRIAPAVAGRAIVPDFIWMTGLTQARRVLLPNDFLLVLHGSHSPFSSSIRRSKSTMVDMMPETSPGWGL